jgi:hypothetical protein
VRLAVPHLVPGDDDLERPRGQLLEDGVRQQRPRHRHQGARDAVSGQLVEQLAGAGTPRDPAPDGGHHALEQPVDDLLGRQVDAAVRADVLGRGDQRVADERVRVLLGPDAAVLGDDLVLGLDPVRLGVDEGAVHVPQHGGGQVVLLG